MPRGMVRRACLTSLLLCTVLAWPAAALAAAATVDFTIGSPVAVATNGEIRGLAKGSRVDSGDAVKTNDGRVQLRFSDGAYVSLQPQTEFRIDDYQYENKTDGSERGFFSLIKGGLRTITGLVGRTNKKNYRISTSVATIGIRGTEYTLSFVDGLTGSVGEGAIEVCSGAGCVPFGSGQSFVVPTSTSKPQLTGTKTDLPPNQPSPPAPTFVAGDVVNSTGLPPFLLTGSQILTTAYSYGFAPSIGVFSPGPEAAIGSPVQLSPAGAVTTMLVDTCGDGCIQTATFDSVSEFGNIGVVAWGAGVLNTGNPAISSIPGPVYVPYVVGLPFTQNDLNALALSRTVGVYTMAGATNVYGVFSGQPGPKIGTVVDSTLTVIFDPSSPTATWAANLSVVGTKVGLSAPMTVFPGSQGTTMRDNGCTVSTGGSCSVAGGIFTSKASGAGVVYSGNTSLGANSLSVTGAIAYSLKP